MAVVVGGASVKVFSRPPNWQEGELGRIKSEVIRLGRSGYGGKVGINVEWVRWWL